jgi:hypothetical protein
MDGLRWRTALVAGLACASCSSVYVSTWSETLERPIELDRKRVAAIVVSADESIRSSGEDALARELSRGGAQGTESRRLAAGAELQDAEAVRRILTEANVEGAVVLWVVAAGSHTELPDPSHRSFREFWRAAWPAADPGDEDVAVLTLVYSVTGDRLLWAGRSGAASPGEAANLLRKAAVAARKEMKRAGLLS